MATDTLALPPPPQRPLLAAPRPDSRKRIVRIIVAVLVAMLVLFAIGYFFHHKRVKAAEEAAHRRESAVPAVNALIARRSTDASRLLLPGSVAPIAEASIFARASGYVRNRYVDLGDRVHRGQVLAQIESPELDEQVAQASQQADQAGAAVDDAKARVDLARITWQRYKTLVEQDSASRQDADQAYQSYLSAQATVASSVANERAAQANLRRLTALQDFEKLRAPFDGVITTRNIEVGMLVNPNGGVPSSSAPQNATPSTAQAPSAGAISAGAAQGASMSASSPSSGADTELFRIAQTGRMRILVSVPQPNAATIRNGSPASVMVREVPRAIEGKVVRSASALDPVSRTLLTEVDVDNPDGTLLPGMYAQVRLESERENPPLLLPGSALLMGDNGAQVAILEPLPEADRQKVKDPDDAKVARRVHLVEVSIGRDYGTEVEIIAGLEGDEWVVSNPGDAVREGGIVVPRFPAGPQESRGNAKPGGASERSPSGIGSSSMEAPTQGAQKGAPKGKGGEEGKGRGRKKRDKS
ncbi:MAG TPA: efflux RND transporter periplasmic adaptor subunit [Usitatibacter sp.]|nr:efflux RND transporter periplasmic adaptor subunit [Usitatibacter sp.]